MKLYPFASRLGSWLRANNKAPFFVALMVFIATFAAYLYYWGNLRANVQKDMNTVYQRQVRILSANLATRLQLYETLLRGGAGLFMLSDSITSDSWTQYFEPYEISKNYPDIEGIGFSRYLTKDQLQAFIDERRADGAPDYTVFPEGERPQYVPVTFNARYTGNNGQSIGYDGFQDPKRREAMLRAAESGEPAMSGRIELVSEERPNRPAFIIYLPVYRPGLPLDTPGERRDALYGFSYVAVDVRTMLDDLQRGGTNPNFGLRLRDPEHRKQYPSAEPAYASDRFERLSNEAGGMTTTSTVSLYGRKWEMTFAGGAGLISSAERELPAQALLRGVFSSLLFACIVWYLITYRERRINHWKQQEVQTAKDDLLSLASHQLRTPATVVKQYVGMLLQGYGGELSDQQVKMLNNAYDSNERQLEIINQLLYVARLDAGRISLRKDDISLPKLVTNVVNDQRQAAEDRHQHLTTHLPKRLSVNADQRYLRMALENLLSNAIKYTPEGGKIRISARVDGGEVLIAVKDTGVGLDMASTTTIFEKFTRVENSLSNDVNGSGVGLYLTKQIISLHGGEIEVESAPNKGSTFTIRLPIASEEVPTTENP